MTTAFVNTEKYKIVLASEHAVRPLHPISAVALRITHLAAPLIPVL